jgi:hypothetical protein
MTSTTDAAAAARRPRDGARVAVVAPVRTVAVAACPADETLIR